MGVYTALRGLIIHITLHCHSLELSSNTSYVTLCPALPKGCSIGYVPWFLKSPQTYPKVEVWHLVAYHDSPVRRSHEVA